MLADTGAGLEGEKQDWEVRTVDAAVGDRDGDKVRQEYGQSNRQGGQNLQAAPIIILSTAGMLPVSIREMCLS